MLIQGRTSQGAAGVENAAATCCVLQGGFGLPFIIVGRPLEGGSNGGGRAYDNDA
jgi:hypothetical protein